MQRPEAVGRVDIRDEMRQSYVDYAMSVIVGRALPDVRDGVKPVHRRTLYAMYEMNLTYGRPYRKSARVVGDVMGKYHPHGDAAIYDALVRMAQDFSMRYPLVDGQGNFGSMDGDPPAAMRYTEVRLSRITDQLLDDIDKETVDFVPNYDESLREPSLLPARLPNLLVNGSSGIAVGMATNIPPHNLGEVVDGLVTLIDNPNAAIEELMTVIKGPDFPTGAIICGTKGIENAYRTGRGLIKLRARAMTETEAKSGKEKIVVTQIPYQVNKAKLVEKIADLVRNKVVEGIADIRDESDKSGTRIVIELKKDQPAETILYHLYSRTQMETTFGAIFLGLLNNQPRIMNLKELLESFIYHRREVIYRRTSFDLRKAEEKAHILEGLKKAVDNVDQVINLIRRSDSPDTARQALMRALDLTQVQAQAILDLRLQRLTSLEQKKIVDDYENTLKEIQRLRGILESERKIMEIMKGEFLTLKKSYGDPRKTMIGPDTREINLEDMIVEEDMVVTVSNTGYIKRNPISLYRAQRRGGKGKMGMQTRKEDFVEHLFVASTHDYMLFFSNVGKVHWLKVYDIPQAGRAARGKAIVNLLQLEKGENVTAMMAVKDFEKGKCVFMVTRSGIVKKTSLSAHSTARRGGIIALTLDEGDELISVSLTDGSRTVLIGTYLGQAICFKEDQVREMGRTARGVIGIRLREGDSVVGATLMEEGATILSVTENGFGKRTPMEEYRITRRGGLGVTNVKCTKKNGFVAGIKEVFDEDEIMIITAEGKIMRLVVNQIRVIGRSTQGVKLIDLEEGGKVVGLARLAEKDED